MAQIHTQQFIVVVAQLLQRPFGSRNTGDQKLNVQQPQPMPVLQFKTRNRSIERLALKEGLVLWQCFFKTVFMARYFVY